MLVLTRKLHQSVMIGEIEVTVIEVRGDQVRLGVNAPRDVAVHRKEIYLQVQQENQAAALAAPSSTAGMPLDEIKRRPLGREGEPNETSL